MTSHADIVQGLDLMAQGLDLSPMIPTLQERVDHAKAQVDAAAAPVAETPKPEPIAPSAGAPRLSMILRKYRVVVEIEPADLAKQMGITTRQLLGFESGKDCGSEVLARVLAWVMGAA